MNYPQIVLVAAGAYLAFEMQPSVSLAQVRVLAHNASVWLRSRSEGAAHGEKSWLERNEGLIPWVLFATALVLRSAQLASTPNTVTADELDYALNSLYTLHGRGPSFFGLDWTPQPAFSMYVRTWHWQLFGPSLFNLRFVSAFVTSLAMFPFYHLARRLVSVPAASLGTLLLASSWWFLLFGRSGWNNGDIVTYMLWGALALTLALERRQQRFWALFGVCLTLLIYGYFAGRTVAVGFALYLTVLLAVRLLRRGAGSPRELVRGGLIAGAVTYVLFYPQLLTILAAPDVFNRRVQATYIFAHLPAGISPMSVLRDQINTTWHSFFLLDRNSGTGRYKGPDMAWLDGISGIFYWVGLIVGLERLRRTLLWWLLLLVPLAFTQLLTMNIPDGARGVAAIAPMCMFATLAIDWIGNAVRPLRPLAFAVLAALCAVAAFNNVTQFGSWVNSPPEMMVRGPAIPSSDFDTWRQYEESQIVQDLPTLNATDYDRYVSTKIRRRTRPAVEPVNPRL